MARPQITEPTDTHLRILRVIVELSEKSSPPVISDIVRELRYASISSLSGALKIMERMELIKASQQGRGKIVIATQKGREAIGIHGIPLSGIVPAGNLSEVFDSSVEFIDLTDLIPVKKGDFLLRVEGESMIGAGILPGDIVLVRPNIEPRPGEIAAVLVGDERKATLKRVFLNRAKREVRLQAANPAFPDQIICNEEILIAGVFQTLVRHREGIRIDAS